MYRGSVEGDTWAFTDENPADPRRMKGRIVVREISPTVQSYHADVSADRKLDDVLEGEMTKVR